MADLQDFYPAPTQASPNGAGAPASPGAVRTSAGASIGGAPAAWVLAIAAVSLFLLHKA